MNSRLRRYVKRHVIVAALFVLSAACGRIQNGGSSNLSIHFPEASKADKDQKLRGLAGVYDYSLACYAVNVTAYDIPSSNAGTCLVPIGVFQGFVGPGGTISLTIPHGTGRKLEIYSFLRPASSDPCPTNKLNLNGLDLTSLVRLGEVASFDAMTSEVDLTVNLQPPASGVNLATQYSMPSTCTASTTAAPASAGIVAGQSVSAGGSYKMVGTVSGQQNEIFVQGGAYQARLSRRPQ